jgi:hypothetical protein
MFPREAPQLRSDPVARIGSLRMMNRPHPAHANGFRFRRARRLFVFVAAVLMRVLRFCRGGSNVVRYSAVSVRKR